MAGGRQQELARPCAHCALRLGTCCLLDACALDCVLLSSCQQQSLPDMPDHDGCQGRNNLKGTDPSRRTTAHADWRGLCWCAWCPSFPHNSIQSCALKQKDRLQDFIRRSSSAANQHDELDYESLFPVRPGSVAEGRDGKSNHAHSIPRIGIGGREGEIPRMPFPTRFRWPKRVRPSRPNRTIAPARIWPRGLAGCAWPHIGGSGTPISKEASCAAKQCLHDQTNASPASLSVYPM